jgi:hypothetical protein
VVNPLSAQVAEREREGVGDLLRCSGAKMGGVGHA